MELQLNNLILFYHKIRLLLKLTASGYDLDRSVRGEFLANKKSLTSERYRIQTRKFLY